MFTPPPSPLPLSLITLTQDESDSRLATTTSHKENASERSSLSPPDPVSAPYSDREEKRMRTAQAAAAEALIDHHERKRRTGRRTRWAVLLAPAVLILVALSSRRISMFGAYDDDWDSHLDADVDGIKHALVHDGLPPRADVVWRNEDIQQRGHRRHKRQTFTLSDPAAPSSSDLITASSSSSDPSSSAAPSSAAPSSAAPSSTASPTTTVPQTEQTIPPVPDSSNPPILPTPFPQPYDTTGATSNLTTQACANFFTNMTQAKEFRTCRPFSLLEYFSSEFIQSQENLTELNTLVYGTCTTTTPESTCVSNMNWFANALTSSCPTELDERNEVVEQTLLGLRSYDLLRNASCLVNQQSNTYCYADAAHDASAADLFLYQLPLGVGFPVNSSAAQPSCSSCARGLLGMYADAVKRGGGGEGGLGQTYEDAAKEAVSVCGSGYALIGVQSSGGVRLEVGRWEAMGLGLTVLLGVVVLMLLPPLPLPI